MRRSNFMIWLLILFFGAFLWAGNEQESKIFPYKYHMKDLDNGLRVIVIPTDYPNIVALQIPVSTGSRNEVEKGKSGFAHFFEHMMFRGTEKYPADQYNAILKNAGADQNVDIGATLSFGLDTVTFSDPGALDTHTATVDYGDGTVIDILQDGSTDVKSPLTIPDHTYDDNVGAYTVTVTVTDNEGAFGTDTLTVNVELPLSELDDPIGSPVDNRKYQQGSIV